MKLDLGAAAKDAATGVVRAWPWLVGAVLFRLTCDWAEIWIDIAWTEADPQRQGLSSDSLGALILREALNGLVLGVVFAAVLHALALLPDGRLVRGLRAWPTAFATGLIWSLHFITGAAMLATGLGRFDFSPLGMVLAGIAALLLSVCLSYATGGAVVRGTGVVESFRDSLRLTRGHRWGLLMISVGLTVFYGLAYYIGYLLGQGIRDPWASFAAEHLTVRTAATLCFVVLAAVWASLNRIRTLAPPEGADRA